MASALVLHLSVSDTNRIDLEFTNALKKMSVFRRIDDPLFDEFLRNFIILHSIMVSISTNSFNGTNWIVARPSIVHWCI